MARKRILIYPDPGLRKTARPITKVTGEIGALAKDMLETMYDAPGIGLAGPQVGVMLRIFVMDCAPKEDEPDPLVLLNPELVWESDDLAKHEEGCLSIPGQYADVVRPERIVVGYQDLQGRRVEAEYADLHARCIQHEIDHLDGKLFIDHLSLVKRQMIKRRLAKARKNASRA